MRWKNGLKVFLFIIIFLLLFSEASKLVTAPDYWSYQVIEGFCEEPPGALDAVFVGASGVFTSCLSPVVWGKSGIAVWDLAMNSQPMSVAKYMIEEARKTQPNALYLIYTGLFDQDLDVVVIHNLTDYMPEPLAKFKMIHTLSDLGEIPDSDRGELYVPMVRYHSRWSELVEKDFRYSLTGLKAYEQARFFQKIQDVSQSLKQTEERAELSQKGLEQLEGLLSYCKEENVNALFVSPVAVSGEESVAQQNTIMDICQSWGFPVLDMAALREEMGLDMERDYYNTGHTNIHGALKISEYLADYLAEHYDFADKRGDPAYAGWDEAYEKYADVSAPYVLDIEWTGEVRDRTLAAPALQETSVDGARVDLRWDSVDGADGYRIYRKTAKTGWEPLATVDGEALHYADELDASGEYTYTVIGYRENDGNCCWGCFDYNGVKATVDTGKK